MAATIFISLAYFLILNVLTGVFYPYQVLRRENTLTNGKYYNDFLVDVQHRTIFDDQSTLVPYLNSVMVCRKLTRAHRIRFAICKWTRHGYTYLASPERSYVPDLIICMDVHPNPGWESANSATRTPPFPAKRTPYANEAVISGVATLKNKQFHHRLPVVNRAQPIHLLLNHQYKFKPVLHSSRKGIYRRSRAGKRVQEKKMEQNKSKIQVLVTHRRPRTKSIVYRNSSNLSLVRLQVLTIRTKHQHTIDETR